MAYVLTVTNSGAAATDGSPINITDALPAGVTINPNPDDDLTLIHFRAQDDDQAFYPCDPGPPVHCVVDATEQAGKRIIVTLPVNVAPPAVEGTTATNQVSVSGGGAPPASATERTPVTSAPATFGFQSTGSALTDAAGSPTTQAGAHPYQLHIDFQTNTNYVAGGKTIAPAGTFKDISADLPAGLVVNPSATPLLCTEAQFEASACPDSSAVGVAHAASGVGGFLTPSFTGPIYNLVPPPGTPAALGFAPSGLGVFIHLLGRLRTGGDYGLSSDTEDILQQGQLSGVSVDLWGSPSDPAHDPTRGICSLQGGSCPVPATDTPFLTMPSACSGPLTTALSVDSWEDPGNPVTASRLTSDQSGTPVGVTGCSQLHFDPTLTAQPDTAAADSPTGLDVDLKVPQATGLDTLATANLRQATATLPQGMVVNPSLADGLQACSPTQIGLHTAAEPTCPDASKIGTVDVTTPLLADHLTGSVYLAKQTDNPFGTLLALYVTAEADGALVKLAGKVEPDPVTGQLKATFADNPELPFSDFQLHFKGGSRSSLISPPSCGTYQTQSQLSPWSAADPDNPTPAETVTSTDSFQVTTGPGGGPCPDYTDPARFTPSFSAGTVTPQAGGYSPFVLKITRPDGQQSLKQIHIDMPPGLVAKLNGVPRCAQSQITPGVGGTTSCPAGSQIGVVNVGAGAGNTPFFLQNQPVYLTDGYAGAPYGIAIDTHALAGPFDLGHVVIRSTLNVDPDDAQVHIDSEQLPNIIQGIPLHIRSVAVNVDRLGFILNPTNCNPMQVTGSVTGGGADFANPADDTVKPVSTPFQVSGCGALGFSPHLSGTILNGAQGIHRSDHPNLQFNLGYSLGDANIASVGVLLPSSFQIDQANLGNICSETQLATNECAGRNPVGTASATTPILGSTLSGPVYAVSGSGGLPKLAVILHGPPADPVKLLIRGITSTVGARILNTFPLVPDAPVSNFQLTLNGGPTGYLVNNTDVCAGAKGKSKKARKKASRLRRTNLTADANFTAQDGDTLSQSVPIAAQCPKAKKSKKSNRSARQRKH